MLKTLTRLIIPLVLIFAPLTAKSQELSTLGKTFWMTFMETIGNPESPHQLKIVVSSSKPVTGTVKNFITNISMPFSITGTNGGVDTVLVPVSVGYMTGSEAGSNRNKGLLIQASDTISVAAQNTKPASCDAALIYPIEALGVDYRVLSFAGDLYSGGGTNSTYRSSFAIVATENNTTIEITPTALTSGGNPANATFTITLNKGESYQVKANTKLLDLTGTLIQAKDCKKIAVFGGSTRSVIVHPSCGAGINSADHLFEQMMPINTWGKRFAMIPTTWQPNTLRKFELVKVVASQPNTRVFFNGRSKNLASAGSSDTFYIATGSFPKEALIWSVKPFAVCQYGLSQRCDGGTSDTDPFMMWLSPLEQTLKFLNFSCENADKIDKFFINVVVKTQYRNQLRIDGNAPTATWKLIEKDTSYSYIQQSGLGLGSHNMTHPVGFFASLYAYGDYGSYGYSVGSSVKPLSFYSIVNGKSSADFEADSLFYTVCEDATIPFDGGGSSTTGVTWKWLIRDRSNNLLTGFPKSSRSFSYTFKDSGRYSVTMIAQRPTNGVCNGLTSIDDTVKSEVRVYKRPDIKLMNDTTICFGNSVAITSYTDGDTNYTFSPATWLSCTNCYMPVSKPLKDTSYFVSATYKACAPSRDTIRIRVRDSFHLTVCNDTTICRGTNAILSASAWGGLSSNLQVSWSHGLGTGLSKTVAPKTTTTYMAVLTDGCSRDGNGNFYADTAYVKVTVHDSLKITMPKDTLVCEGNDVTLSVSIAGGKPGAAYVTWDQGLGTGLTKTVTMGSNDVTYKAVLADGCTNPEDSGYVTVKVRPGMRIDTIMYNNPVCKNQNFTIRVKARGGDSTGYKFKLFNTTTGSFVLIDSAAGLTYPSFTVNVPDDASFSLRMNQSCNSQQTSKKFDVKIKTGLSIQNPVPASDTICNGRSYKLTVNGSSADNLPIKFVLKRKTGTNTYTALDSATHASTATFTITPAMALTDYLVVANDNCSRNDSTTFRLLVRVPMTIGPLTDDELCRNESKTYTAMPSGGRVQSYTYRWYEVLSNNTIGSNRTLTYTPPQSMDIAVEVKDGCSDSVKTGARLWVAPLVTDSLLATKTDGCEPMSTVFYYPKTETQSPLNPAFTWKWYFDGVNTVNTPSSGGATHADIPKSYSVAGVYNGRVEMFLSNNKVCFTEIQQIDVWEQAVANFNYLPKQIDIVEPEVSFSNFSTGANRYAWNFGDGNTDFTQNPKHSYSDTGLFTVTMIAANDHDCNDTISQKLRVLDIYRIHIPTAFSPNKDDFNTIWKPEFTSILTVEVTIFNRWGEKIHFSNDNTGSWDGTYNGVDCQDGVYYYYLKVRDNRKKWHYYNGMITLLR